MNEEQLRLLSRIIKQQEGKDFVEEILKPMLSKNHKDLLQSSRDMRDELIGYGCAIEQLIDLFNTCDQRIETQKKTEAPIWA